MSASNPYSEILEFLASISKKQDDLIREVQKINKRLA